MEAILNPNRGGIWHILKTKISSGHIVSSTITRCGINTDSKEWPRQEFTCITRDLPLPACIRCRYNCVLNQFE